MQKYLKSEFTLLSVPTEMLDEAEIRPESVIQMHSGNGKIIIDAVEPQEVVCSRDCKNCSCFDYCDRDEVN